MISKWITKWNRLDYATQAFYGWIGICLLNLGLALTAWMIFGVPSGNAWVTGTVVRITTNGIWERTYIRMDDGTVVSRNEWLGNVGDTVKFRAYMGEVEVRE